MADAHKKNYLRQNDQLCGRCDRWSPGSLPPDSHPSAYQISTVFLFLLMGNLLGKNFTLPDAMIIFFL